MLLPQPETRTIPVANEHGDFKQKSMFLVETPTFLCDGNIIFSEIEYFTTDNCVAAFYER